MSVEMRGPDPADGRDTPVSGGLRAMLACEHFQWGSVAF